MTEVDRRCNSHTLRPNEMKKHTRVCFFEPHGGHGTLFILTLIGTTWNTLFDLDRNHMEVHGSLF
jgi:hypothetical protein